MRAPSDATKRKQKRGQGHHETYIPWIRIREVPSRGLSSAIVDVDTHRTMHFLSRVESDLYYLLKWDQRTDDIREQYPLDLHDTLKICAREGIRHPMRDGEPTPFTTDIVVTLRDGSETAYACKYQLAGLTNREKEKLLIEKMYWAERGVRWMLITHDMLNTNMSDNVRRCLEYYDQKYVRDDVQYIKHMISHRRIAVDMEHGLLDFGALAQEYIIDADPEGKEVIT